MVGFWTDRGFEEIFSGGENGKVKLVFLWGLQSLLVTEYTWKSLRAEAHVEIASTGV